MTPERLFSLLNAVTMAAWLPLLVLPRARWATTVVPVAVPALLSLVYVVLAATSLPGSDGGFASLAEVGVLFARPWALLAGWTHYLAFDLLIGGWEVRDAQRRGVPHLFVVPALVLTFLAGPGGLLLYLGIRAERGARRYGGPTAAATADSSSPMPNGFRSTGQGGTSRSSASCSS